MLSIYSIYIHYTGILIRSMLVLDSHSGEEKECYLSNP